MIILSLPLAASRGSFHQLYTEYKWWSLWRWYNEGARRVCLDPFLLWLISL